MEKFSRGWKICQPDSEMAFNIEKLVKFCIAEIEEFAEDHQNETFYGFVIDADMLCLNSVEEAEKTLTEYQDRNDRLMRRLEKWEDITEEDFNWDKSYDFEIDDFELFINADQKIKDEFLSEANDDRERRRQKGNPYRQDAEIKDLRENTGDWAYQGFADMTSKHGFDNKAYDRHYGMSDERQKTSAYGKAMDEVLKRLKDSNVFKCLKTTDDFYIIRVEHDY